MDEPSLQEQLNKIRSYLYLTWYLLGSVVIILTFSLGPEMLLRRDSWLAPDRITLRDQRGRPRIDLVAEEGKSVIVIWDGQNRPAAYLAVDEDGKATLELHDPNNRVAFQAP